MEQSRAYCQTAIPGMGPKSSQDTIIRRALALEHLDNNYPMSDWVHVYTDGSADDAVRNGGAGIYIRYPMTKKIDISYLQEPTPATIKQR